MRLASIKLLSGEEILTEVIEFNQEKEFSSLVVKNPVKVELNTSKRKLKKDFKLSRWMVFTNTVEHEISVINIIAMTAILDKEIEQEYLKFVSGDENLKLDPPKLLEKPAHKQVMEDIEKELSQEYGYLGSVKEFKNKLEEIFKLDVEEPKDL